MVVTISYFFGSISCFFLNTEDTVSECINGCDVITDMLLLVFPLTYCSSKTLISLPTETELKLLSIFEKKLLY